MRALNLADFQDQLADLLALGHTLDDEPVKQLIGEATIEFSARAVERLVAPIRQARQPRGWFQRLLGI